MEESQEKDEDVKGLDDDDEAETIDLRCQDGIIVKAERSSAMMSKFISNAVSAGEIEQEVQIFHLDSVVVGKVLEYTDYHRTVKPRTIEAPLKCAEMEDLVDPFDAAYVKSLSQKELFQLLLAANYMAVTSLVTLLCAKVATLMKDKTPHVIRKTFGVREFTPEEREEVRKNFPDLIE